MNAARKSILCALAAVLMFATIGTGFKLAVGRLGGYTATVWIGLFATLALLFYVVVSGRAGRITAELKRAPLFFAVTGALGLGLQQILCLTSYQYLPAAQVVILTYTYPLQMILLSWLLFRETTSLTSLGCVLLGFVGVCLVLSQGSLLVIGTGIGVALCLGTAFTFALFCILIKHRSFDVFVGMFLFNLFGLLFLLLLLPWFQLTVPDGGLELAGLLYLGVVPTGIAYILWNRALQLAPSSQVGNFALLTPPLSLVCIALVLREPIRPVQVAGMALIVGSVFLNVRLTEQTSLSAATAGTRPEPRSGSADRQ